MGASWSGPVCVKVRKPEEELRLGSSLERGDEQSSPQLLRILGLHGNLQTRGYFTKQCAQLQQALEGMATIEVLEAPHWTLNGGRGWIESDMNLGPAPEAQTKAHRKWTQTLALLRGHLESSGPYDGVMGYSMGTPTLTCLLAACAAEGVSPPFRFALCFNGYAPVSHHQLMADLEAHKPLKIPSLHVLGEQDWIPPHVSLRLVGFYQEAGRKLIRHPGKHDLPRNAADISEVVDFVRQFAAKHT